MQLNVRKFVDDILGHVVFEPILTQFIDEYMRPQALIVNALWRDVLGNTTET